MAIAMFALAQPTLAFNQAGRTGQTGHFGFQDTHNFPDGQCHYGPGVNSLRSIYVSFPDVGAAPGFGTEKVGWQYTVQRKLAGAGWTDRLTSKVLTAYAQSSSYANFPDPSARVIVPKGPEGAGALYRVNIKAFWFAADGTTVIGTATASVKYYSQWRPEDEAQAGTATGACPAYFR